MWTVEVVKARFWEAADVERRMFVKGMSSGGNAWPSYRFDKEDRAGWPDDVIEEDLKIWMGRKPVGTPEFTRWEEVFFDWTQLIPEPRRLLVWRWSQCIAFGKSFSKYCEEKGLVRATAYNRLERVFKNLTNDFRIANRLLRRPDDKWAGQFEGPQAFTEIRSDEVVATQHQVDHPPFRTEPHRDMLGTAEAVAEFSKHLADVNDQRRRARLRKALRGVPGEQEAA